jgi:hypothetical protein
MGMVENLTSCTQDLKILGQEHAGPVPIVRGRTGDGYFFNGSFAKGIFGLLWEGKIGFTIFPSQAVNS